ncbi:MAG: polyphenol oxidase family protein [Deltaproteobacteria bacterium]|nr:polyphenol oxidase family protein [Deltaproteobacteria bacterium]
MSAGTPAAGWLTHPLLGAAAAHGFGTRGCRPPAALLRARQVHGTRVVVLRRGGPPPADPGEADALVSERASLPIGVVTADCLPILVATPAGRVAAVHAGWRGLAAGVIGEALAALASLAPEGVAGGAAVIGPRVGAGCYEVDEPVVAALARRFAGALDAALVPVRAGHWQLDLAALARVDLVRAGLAADRVRALANACTSCDERRFHSYRRDGPGSGRLFHWIAARGAGPDIGLDTPIGPA